MNKKLVTTDLKSFVKRVHQPYTDYNEDIAKWLSSNAVCSYSVYSKITYRYIFTCYSGKFYAHDNVNGSDIYYTNDEFKELIGMTKKLTSKEKLNEIIKTDGEEAISWLKLIKASGFTKSDLKAGVVVTNAGGNVYVVRGDRIVKEGGYVLLDDINADLTVSGPFGNILNITKVERPVVMYERVDVYKQNITKELEFAKAKMLRLQSHIDVLESKIK